MPVPAPKSRTAALLATPVDAGRLQQIGTDCVALNLIVKEHNPS